MSQLLSSLEVFIRSLIARYKTSQPSLGTNEVAGQKSNPNVAQEQQHSDLQEHDARVVQQQRSSMDDAQAVKGQIDRSGIVAGPHNKDDVSKAQSVQQPPNSTEVQTVPHEEHDASKPAKEQEEPNENETRALQKLESNGSGVEGRQHEANMGRVQSDQRTRAKPSTEIINPRDTSSPTQEVIEPSRIEVTEKDKRTVGRRYDYINTRPPKVIATRGEP